MINDYKNVPCVVKHNNVYYKTSKTASFFSKHREMNNDDTEIYYIDDGINDRALIDKALSSLENKLKGIEPREKEIFKQREDPIFQYRLNVNTILSAWTLIDLDRIMFTSRLINDNDLQKYKIWRESFKV